MIRPIKDFIDFEASRIQSYAQDIYVKANKNKLLYYLDSLNNNEIDKKLRIIRELDTVLNNALFRLYNVYDDNTFNKNYFYYFGHKGTVVTLTLKLDKIFDEDVYDFYKVDNNIIIKIKHEYILKDIKDIEKEWTEQSIETLEEMLKQLKKAKLNYHIEYIQ